MDGADEAGSGGAEIDSGANDAGPDPAPIVPVGPRPDTTRWVINWAGVVPVVLAVVAVLILSQMIGGDDDATDAAAVTRPAATSPADGSTIATTTTTRPTLTTTTLPATTTTTEVGEPQVRIRGEIGPCRFGDACLIAGFSIVGFDEHPGTFTCIYPNSERDRSFSDDVVDVACVTNDDGDTITIEVAGVRSATISEENLDGTEGD